MTCAAGLFIRSNNEKESPKKENFRREGVPRTEENPQKKKEIRQKQSLTNIVYSAGLAELIVQLLGAFYLGHTTDVGRRRGFYLAHHLTPYYQGKNAYIMYIGALIWTIGCPIFVIVWIAITLLFASILGIFYTLKDEIKKVGEEIGKINVLHHKKDVPGIQFETYLRPLNYIRSVIKNYGIQRRLHAWLLRNLPPGKLLSFLTKLFFKSHINESSEIGHSVQEGVHGRNFQQTGDDASSLVQFTDNYSIPEPELHIGSSFTATPRTREAERSTSSADYVPLAQEPSPSTHKENIRAGSPFQSSARALYSPIPRTDEESLGDTSGRVNYKPYRHLQRRRERRYPVQSIISNEPQHTSWETVPLSGGLNRNAINIIRKDTNGASRYDSSDPGSDIYQPNDPDLPGSIINDPIMGTQYHGGQLNGSTAITTSRHKPQILEDWQRKQDELWEKLWEEGLRADEWRKRIMWLAIVIGVISYVAQWMFWDGFVKASGPR
jgi:hypothetical protein